MRHEEAARNRAAQVRRQNGTSTDSIEAVVTSILGKVLGQYSNQIRSVSDKALTLNGERDVRLAAVRFGHLKPFTELRVNTRSRKVTSAPTAEQYNSLLDDLRDVYAAFNQLSSAIEKELGHKNKGKE